MTDVILFAHRNGRDYLAAVDDVYWRWPAEHDGWRRRTSATLAELDAAEELPPTLADLALRLSGASLP
jgi:hypothetical protein